VTARVAWAGVHGRHGVRVLVGLIAICATGSVLSAALHASGLRVNLSPSMPRGVYRARPVAHGVSFRRGTIVLVCLPQRIAAFGRARGYLPTGDCPGGSAPIGKPVFAIAGDTVTITSTGLKRAGAVEPHTHVLTLDATGRLLAGVPRGRYRVATDELWLVSSYSDRSWDSRYYGPVAVSTVIGVLAPLWTSR
jgi:conjugative transfer signal peptidase TraF